MNSPRQQEWQQLLALSETMQVQAEAGEWEPLERLAVERHARLEAFFATPVPAALAAQVAEGIRQIAERDAHIGTLGRTARDLFNQDSQLLQQRRRASQAYCDPQHNQR